MIEVDAMTAVSAEDPQPASDAPGAEAGRPLRETIRRGAVWSLLGYGGVQGLRFAGNLVLTRLLFPEAFGLMALVNALLTGLQLFSDIGIGPSIIQSRYGAERAFLDTAWTVQIVRGLLLWLAACAAALPFAAFYGEPALGWILPVAGLTAVIAGFDSTRLFSLYRRVDLARVSLVEVSCQALSVGVMVAWASRDRSIVALLAGGFASSLARLVLSHTVLPGHRNRLAFDRPAFGRMIRFGRWIFLSTVLTFLVGQSDRLIFGKLIPLSMLGVFGVGALIATLPSEVLSRLASSVLFPAFSSVRNAGRDLGSVFARVRRPALVLAAWMIAGLAGGGSVAVDLLYDQRYAEAGWIVQVVALGSWFAVLESTYGAGLLACGQAKWTAASGAGKLVGMLCLIPLGFYLGGFFGAVVGLAISEVARYAVSAWGASTAGLKAWPHDLAMTTAMLLSAGLAWLTAGFVQRQGLPTIAAAGAVFLLVTLLWTPAAIACLRQAAPARSKP
jgi:O-antigen/teichoic acid export membrane protein